MLRPSWLPDVLVALSGGPVSYTGLLEGLRDYGAARHRRWPQPILQDAVLHRTLRWMVQRGLVTRAKEGQFPFRAVYRLTPPAQELAELTAPMAEWAVRHEDLLELDRRARVQRRPSSRDRSAPSG